MKLASPDRRFLYYLRERPDAASEGLRISCSQARPVFSAVPVRHTEDLKRLWVSPSILPLPMERGAMPGDTLVLIVLLSEEHPELPGLLMGSLRCFSQALRLA